MPFRRIAGVAGALGRLGFKTAGWSRAAKNLPGVETFRGNAGLDTFLARSEILVCLLPRTRDTERILNIALFRKLKRDGAAGGAFLINAGRGPLQVDADILTALGEGTLAGASGVFRVTEFEESLKKRFGAKSLDGLTVPAEGMGSDIHGSAEYRAHLVGVLARRAVAAAVAG